MYISARNSEGYYDPTAQMGLQSAQDEAEEADVRCKKLISAIKNLIDLSDYELIARIEVRDRKTGRVYR